jgi:hypothetical protein
VTLREDAAISAYEASHAAPISTQTLGS